MTPTDPTDPVDDDLYTQAKALVLRQRQASVALVQCHLRLGYAAACRLFERMQAEGLVVPVATGRWRLADEGMTR